MATRTSSQTAEVQSAAKARYLEQALAAAAAARAAGQVWSEVNLDRIAASWLDLMFSRVLHIVSAAQLAAARGASIYVDRIRRIRRRDRPPHRVEHRRFAGIASDGRPLTTLLTQPAGTTLRAIRDGAPPRTAAVLGATQLDMIVRSEVADAGRVATGVEVTATPTLGYVRMLSPPSCSRCAVLAGRFYRWNSGFQRHPRCDCIHIPATEDQADDLRTDPQAYFDSLSEAEQNRVFTNAGAAAIRDGANLGRVVNARRGMTTTASGRLTTQRVMGRDVFTTTEGTRRRRGGAPPVRLMPEAIYLEARGSRDEAIRLLRLHGYIS
jgi:hypothetical protein